MIHRLVGHLRTGLDTLASLGFVVVCVVFVRAMTGRPRQAPPARAQAAGAPRPEPPLPAQPLSLGGAALLGNKAAKVALVVYSDFQCPYCGRFEHDVFPALNAKYVQPGKILVAFRQFPLPIHPYAEKAAEAAECASKQGKFWPMHDQLFEHQDQLNTDNLETYAKSTGLNVQAFDACLAGHMTDLVARDLQSGRDLSVNGTPTLFVGRIQADGSVKIVKRLVGARPLTDFQAALDPLLTSTKSNGV